MAWEIYMGLVCGYCGHYLKPGLKGGVKSVQINTSSGLMK